MPAMIQDLPAELSQVLQTQVLQVQACVLRAPAVQVGWHIGTGQPQRAASACPGDHAPLCGDLNTDGN